jgi:ATP synthase protein I
MTKLMEESPERSTAPSGMQWRKDPEDTDHDLSADEESFKPLTREEADSLRRVTPTLSLWHVVLAQLGVGCVVAAVAWLLTGRLGVVWSAGYGALAVVLPAAIFARGLARQQSRLQGSAALAGFVVWEMVKIALTVAMLLLAPRLIVDLSWLALVAGFVVTMKVYWAAMWFSRMPKSTVKNF